MAADNENRASGVTRARGSHRVRFSDPHGPVLPQTGSLAALGDELRQILHPPEADNSGELAGFFARIEIEALHFRTEGRLNAQQAVLDHHASRSGNAHVPGGMKIKTGIWFPDPTS